VALQLPQMRGGPPSNHHFQNIPIRSGAGAGELRVGRVVDCVTKPVHAVDGYCGKSPSILWIVRGRIRRGRRRCQCEAAVERERKEVEANARAAGAGVGNVEGSNRHAIVVVRDRSTHQSERVATARTDAAAVGRTRRPSNRTAHRLLIRARKRVPSTRSVISSRISVGYCCSSFSCCTLS
jgi:hypothetical protein